MLDADTHGVELTARWMPTSRWQVDAWYSRFDVTPHLSPMSGALELAHTNGNAPHDQWQLRWTLLMSPRAEFSTSVHGVGRIAELAVPAYTRVDARLEVPMTRRGVAGVRGTEPAAARASRVGRPRTGLRDNGDSAQRARAAQMAVLVVTVP
jgi:hypothetical protein